MGDSQKILFSSRLACVRTLLFSLFTLVLSLALITASQKVPCDDSNNDSLTENPTKMAGNRERTFIMLKPDAVHRGLVGEIIKRFEAKGFKLVAMKMMHASEELLKEHYADLSSKAFFPWSRQIHGFRPCRPNGLGRPQRSQDWPSDAW